MSDLRAGLPLHTGQYFSKPLGREQSFAYLRPMDVSEETPLPFYVLLHGRTCNYLTWYEKTGIARYAQDYQIVIAFFDGGVDGWYTDGLNGERYESDLLEGFLPALQDCVNLCPSGRHWAIGGFSMGGYGAVKIALKHPGLFGLAISHSGALEITQKPEHHPVFGDPEQDLRFRKSEDVFWLAEQALCRLPTERPKLLLDCGSKDHLLEASRRFSQHLNFLGYGHTYREKPGEHTFPYWNRAIREVLPEVTRKVTGKSVCASV